MNKKTKDFIKYVKSECKKYGVKCDLRNTKYVKLSGNIKCSGYFVERMILIKSSGTPSFNNCL